MNGLQSTRTTLFHVLWLLGLLAGGLIGLLVGHVIGALPDWIGTCQPGPCSRLDLQIGPDRADR